MNEEQRFRLHRTVLPKIYVRGREALRYLELNLDAAGEGEQLIAAPTDQQGRGPDYGKPQRAAPSSVKRTGLEDVLSNIFAQRS